MTTAEPCDLPEIAFLRSCEAEGAYTDCFAVDVDGVVTQAAFVEAFYTTRLFKTERFLIRWLARKPSADLEAKALSEGKAKTFAAWRVEAQSADQLLMADLTGRTKSWLMVSQNGIAPGKTRLYFGSAVIPRRIAPTGGREFGVGFRALLGFHKLYSRMLLNAAAARATRVTRGSGAARG